MIGYKRFAAAGNLPRSLEIDESNTTLALRGFCLDIVVQIGESKEEALAGRDPAFFPNWMAILSALPDIYHTKQSKVVVFWRTLITDTAARAPQRGTHPAAQEFGAAFHRWVMGIMRQWECQPQSSERDSFSQELHQLTPPDEIESTGYLPPKSIEHPTRLAGDDLPDAADHNALLRYSSQTRLLRTSAGYLGLATTSVRQGDSVWIVSGSRVPLILRETDEKSHYKLVGGAYIHGFMQGEALMSDHILDEFKVV